MKKKVGSVYIFRRVALFLVLLAVPVVLLILSLQDNDIIEELPAMIVIITDETQSEPTLTTTPWSETEPLTELTTTTETESPQTTVTETEPHTQITTTQTSATQSEPPQTTTTTTNTPIPTTTATPAEELKATYIDGVLIVNKTYPLPQSYNPGGLTSETQSAFNEMQKAAAAEGLNLYVSSGFRSYDRQKTIYDNNVNSYGREKTDTFSARPGHSEHQTGLAFDLNTIDDSFADTAEGKWVAENAHLFGFVVRYPKGKEAITGYKYEPWHLRYLGVPLATELYESSLTLEEYFGIDSVYDRQ